MDLKDLNAGVRIFHASTIEHPVDIYINDQPKVRGLNYRQATDYLPLPKGKYNLKIYSTNTNKILYNQTINVDGDKFITLSAVDDSGKLTLIVVEDVLRTKRNSSLIPSGNPNLYYSDYPYLSKREQPIDDNNMNGNIIRKVVDQFNNVVEVIVNRLGFVVIDVKNQFGNIIIRAGDRIKKIMDRLRNVVEVVVDSVGKIIARVINEVGNVVDGLANRIGNMIRRVVDQFGNLVDIVVDELENVVGWVIDEMSDLYDTPKAPNNSLLSDDLRMRRNRVQDMSKTARVKFVHLSPNAPAVDITTTDGTVLFANAKYKEASDYIPVEGTYNLQVRPTKSNQVLLSVPNVTFSPNEIYSIYAIGLLNGTPGLEAIVLKDRVN